MHRFAVAVSLFITGTQAHAADWWYVGLTGSGNNESAYFVDQASITTSYSSRKSFWVYLIRETLPASGVRKEKNHFEADCNARTTSINSWVNYGNNGVVKDSYDVPTYRREHRSVVPESIAEGYFNFVCFGPQSGDLQLSTLSPELAAVTLFKD